MCESLVWAQRIIGKGSIKAGLNWVEGLFAWQLMGDQRAGDPALTPDKGKAITCLSALCINPSGAGILALKGRQRQGRDNVPPPNSPACVPPFYAAGTGRMLLGTGGILHPQSTRSIFSSITAVSRSWSHLGIIRYLVLISRRGC